MMVKTDRIIGQHGADIHLGIIRFTHRFPNDIMMEDVAWSLGHQSTGMAADKISDNGNIFRGVPTMDGKAAPLQKDISDQTAILGGRGWAAGHIDGMVEPMAAEVNEKAVFQEHVDRGIST